MIYQKERPRTFDAVLGQEYIVENIRNQSINNSWFNVYILSGQFGSGKTSIAEIIALAANCECKDERGNPCLMCDKCREILSNGLDFWEIDGADNSSVEDVRKLKEYVEYLPTRQKWKIVIIDEVHMLSKSAFNCLLKMLENPPSYVIIILCTTELRAIPMTVRSRAATYSFKRIPYAAIIEGIKRAAPKYGLNVDDAACNLIAHYSDGSLRNAYMLLEQVSVVTHEISEPACMDVLGIIDEDGINRIIAMMLNRDLTGFLEELDRMEQTGKSFSLLATDLLKACADLVMASCGCGERVGGTSYYQQEIIHLADKHSLHTICTLSSLLRDIRKFTESGSKYDFVIYMISVFENLRSIHDRLDRLEQMVQNVDRHTGDENPPALPEPPDYIEKKQESQLPEDGLDIDKDYHALSENEPVVPQEKNEGVPLIHILDEEDENDDFLEGIFSVSNQEAYRHYGTDADEANWDYAPFKENVFTPKEESGCNSQTGTSTIDGGMAIDGRMEAQEEKLGTQTTEDEIKVGGTPAQIVKQAFEQAIASEPILLSKYMMSCEVEETQNGIIVITNDQGVTTQLLLFINSKDISNVEIQYRQPLD